jgi:hypothetical protein
LVPTHRFLFRVDVVERENILEWNPEENKQYRTNACKSCSLGLLERWEDDMYSVMATLEGVPF